MKRLSRLTLFAIAGLALAACEGGGHCVRLALSAQYCLSSATRPRFDAEQASIVSHGGKPLHMITRIHSDADGLRFAGVSPLGQTLVQVSSDRHGVISQLAPGMPEKIDAAIFLALVQLTAWPADEVRKGLRGDLTLVETPQSRALMQDGKTLLTIRWQGEEPPYDRLDVDIPAAGVLVESRALSKDLPE